VTTHHLATETAIDTMRKGGNAVDAAVAANAVLGVVSPDTCGPGGDLFALVHGGGEQRPSGLNASGRAGSGVSAAALREAGHDAVPLQSSASVTVPGCVDGWTALLERHGSRSLSAVLEPAIGMASDGFEVTVELADSLRRIAAMIADRPSAAALYPGGDLPAEGDVISRPDLARTLGDIAANGRDAFYAGAPGRGIIAATDGAITSADLAVDQAEWVDPLGTTLYGIEAWTMPPNSQGHLTLTSSWLAERIGASADLGDPGYHHALIEAYRAVAWERDLLTTDPDTMPLDADDLVSPARLDSRLSRILPDRTASWPSSRPVPGGTMYLCVRDAAGLGVSLIQSNFHGIGSGRDAGATGVFLHNRGAGFTLESGHRNELMPGRRPLHTLSPTLWTKDGSLRMLLGTRGGQYQPQLLLQVASHRFAAGLPLSEAMATPRWIVDHWGPDEEHAVTVESRCAGPIVAELRRRGHKVTTGGAWEQGWGPVAAIEIDESSVVASGDPRVSTSGAGTG
jgi:gamma-glutamyltranspeptidase/glutathione hydrolase